MEDKKLKIAIVCDAFFPMVDGVISVVHNYATILSQKHDVTVFAPATKDKTFKDNYPYKVVRCKIFPINFGDYNMSMPAFDKKFKKALKDGNFDIVHIHSPFTIAHQAIKVANKQKTPIIVTFHSQFQYDFKKATHSEILTNMLIKYVANAFNKCDELWTMNPKMEELSRSYGYNGPVVLTPNGCELKRENIDEQKLNEFRAQYCAPDEKMFLYVGRIHVLKNIEFILRSLKVLKEKGFKFKMIFVGNGQDYNYLTKLNKELDLEDCVKFVGKVSDRSLLQYYFAASDLFLFPSKYDSDGIVKCEAAAFKTPTVFLDGTFAASAATDGYNGYVVNEDAEQFANKIIEIFEDEENYNQVCINAEKTLYLTWDDIVKTAEQQYYDAINKYSNK